MLLSPATIGAVQQDPIRRIFKQSSLDLRFADNKSLVDATTGAQLVTFTRASGGTYVDSTGTIRPATTNLILQSSASNLSPWQRIQATVTQDVAGVVAPDGTETADFLAENTATSEHYDDQSVPVVAGNTYVYSRFYKGTGQGDRIVWHRVAGAANASLTFNPDTLSGISGASFVEYYPNGWTRVAIVFTAASTGNAILRAQVRQGAIPPGLASYAGNGTSGFYTWGAQLEQSSTVGEYIPTSATINSAPRFDHNPVTGESLGLLVEEQRTNSIRNNTMVDAVAGTPGTLPTNWPFQAATNGLAVSIVGTGTESGIAYLDWKISGTTSALATADISFARTAALTGQTWTSSVYIKLVSGSLSAVTTTFIRLVEEDASTNFVIGGSGSITLPTTASLGTQRGSFTRTLSGGATVALVRTNLAVTVSSGSTVDFTLRIGMPQLEQGAFATSVIPTSGTAVTRAADVASISGSNFSSWYRQDEGTVFGSYIGVANITGGQTRRCVEIGVAGSANNRFILGYNAIVGSRFLAVSGGSTQADINISATQGGLINTAAAFAANNFQQGVNGDLGTADTSGSVPSVAAMQIGNDFLLSPGTALNGTIRRLTYWPARLGNDVLQRITQ